MNDRVLKIRKELKLSQDKFGDSLGVTGAAISRIESGDRGLTEQMIKAICMKYNANENWLRTGEGDMFVIYEDEQSELDYLIGRLAPDHDAFKIKFIKFMLKQPDENWNVIEKMIEEYGRYNNNEIAITSDSISVAEAEEKYIKNILKSAPKEESTASNFIEEIKENI